MDNEYLRLLSLNNLSNLYECESGYIDKEDCFWYHSNWLLLRYLGLVSNPFWHEDFYLETIKKFTTPDDRILVVGTADFSMPYLCQTAGINSIEVSDICKSPLNICNNVSTFHGFTWKTRKLNIFDGVSGQYDIIINDAFLTRFSSEKKRIVLERIHSGLNKNGLYITTFRRGWNNDKAIIPDKREQLRFVENAKEAAIQKGINTDDAIYAASHYIERMVSYPIRDLEMIQDLVRGLYDIIQISLDSVPGECTPTNYYRVVFRKV